MGTFSPSSIKPWPYRGIPNAAEENTATSASACAGGCFEYRTGCLAKNVGRRLQHEVSSTGMARVYNSDTHQRPAAACETPPMADQARGTLLKVFIADDSRPVADMLAELAAGSGPVEVVGMGDSEDSTLEGIRRLRPDVVVLDLQLKSGSGANVIRAVRSDPSL